MSGPPGLGPGGWWESWWPWQAPTSAPAPAPRPSGIERFRGAGQTVMQGFGSPAERAPIRLTPQAVVDTFQTAPPRRPQERDQERMEQQQQLADRARLEEERRRSQQVRRSMDALHAEYQSADDVPHIFIP